MSDKKLGVEQALEFADCTQFDGDPRIGLTLFRNVAGVLGKEVRQLRATVSRLPKDADGKPITPGTHRWVTHDDGRAEEVIVEFVGTAAELVVGGLPGTNDECWEEFAADLHSTREAAEAAKE